MESIFIQVPKDDFYKSIETIVRKVQAEKAPIPEPKDETLLSVKEVQQLLRITRPTVTAWTEEGRLRGYRMGSRLRYKKSEVLAALSLIEKYSRQPLNEKR